MARASTVHLAGGLSLSLADQGDSDVAIVFLPGPTDSWLSYAHVLDRMPSSVRAIAVSQRGHGDSEKPASGYRIEDFAADARALLAALDLPRAILVGHSGSCPVARRVALDAPDVVAGLVLEASPSTLVGDAGLTEFLQAVVLGLEDPIDPDFARRFVLDTSSEHLSAAITDDFVHELLKVPARVWREMFEALLQYDDRDALADLTAPTLLIWGDADPLVGLEAQEELLRLLPNATLNTYRGVGHAPRWEDPSRFAADITAFAERVTRS